MCCIHSALHIGVARGAQIFSISSHFVLWKAASQTKILLLAWSQTLWSPNFSPKNFGLAAPLLHAPPPQREHRSKAMDGVSVALLRCRKNPQHCSSEVRRRRQRGSRRHAGVCELRGTSPVCRACSVLCFCHELVQGNVMLADAPV